MCQDPNVINGNLVSCRNCDECVKTRINTWAVRASAEKEVSNHCFVINLTYNDETQENREGSKSFQYKNIVDLNKRIRRQLYTRHGQSAKLRFICAGEIGSKGTKRVHWHIIYFSNYDISELGDVRLFHKPYTDLRKIGVTNLGEEYMDTRLVWSLWPHGLVYFQEPDKEGMRYVCKYCAKDQFAAAKSQGSKRLSKSDNHAKAMFVPSKLPAIGRPFLERRLAEHLKNKTVDTSLRINVPEAGYWYLTGDIRQWYLVRLKFINDERKRNTGTECTAWASLVASVSENEKDMETLGYGEEQEASDDFYDEIAAKLRNAARAADVLSGQRQTRRRCGRLFPCEACQRSLGGKDFDALTREVAEYDGKSTDEKEQNYSRRNPRTINPRCALRNLKTVKAAFAISEY